MSEPMQYKYKIDYTFEHIKSDLRPKDQTYGQGTIPITTDHPIETDADKQEIAKHIFGLIPDCKTVVINSYRLDGDDIYNLGSTESVDIIEGEIVID